MLYGSFPRAILHMVVYTWSFPGDSAVNIICLHCRSRRRLGFDPWVWKIPWRRAWQPTPVFLPGESHWQRSPEGYSPCGHSVRHDWSDLAYTVHIRQSQSPSSFHPSPNYVHMSILRLRVYSYPANRFIYTVFLESTYTNSYVIFVFLFLTYFTNRDLRIFSFRIEQTMI